MASSDSDLDLDEAVGLVAALGHRFRMAVLRVLRDSPDLPLADLRRQVAAMAGPLDTRTLLHHVHRLHDAGVVDLRRIGPRFRVRLVRDVSFKIRGS